jgi:hypothetical protein
MDTRSIGPTKDLLLANGKIDRVLTLGAAGV